MIRRTFDPAEVNAIANAEGVLGDIGALDFTAAVCDRRNVFLTAADFCAMFIWSAPHVYECHIMAIAGSRGAFAMRAGREMLAWMRNIGARMIWGQPSVNNRAAITYIRRMGLSHAGFGDNPVIGPVEFYVLEDLQCRPL